MQANPPANPQAARAPSAGSPHGSTLLDVGGMTCQGCARNVTEAAKSVPGVQRASVDLAGNSLEVHWKSGAEPDVEALRKAVQEAGYTASAAKSCHTAPSSGGWSPTAGWKFNLVFGGGATVAMMLAEWVFGLGMNRGYHWAAFLLATPIQILCGSRFYIGAWKQLKRGSSNMDTLVALGSTTAYAYSAWLLFAGNHGHLYFMDSVAIITLISAGHFLEARTSARAAATLRALLELTPPTARKVTPGGVEERPVAELREGDRIRLLPGDRIPTDAVVVEGRSAVNESMLTGESLPVEKQRGAKLYGGSLNEDGQVEAEVTATGEATALSRIIAIVEQAQQSKARIQRLGDRISSVFVPIVICLAVITALWWAFAPDSARAVGALLDPFLWSRPHDAASRWDAAIYHACAVLIIACPCAMGLATPIALMAGANAAAERGILIRDGGALEKSGTITTVIFDKTGTLTKGKVAVAGLKAFSSEDMMKIAASLAQRSNHPLSKAIASAHQGGILLGEWREIRGYGIEARDAEGAFLRLGSLRWLRQSGVDLHAAGPFEHEWSAKGATVNGLARGQELLGVIALQDQIKEKSREVLQQLARQGLRARMVTGDSQRVAEAIAESLGMPREFVHAEQLPEGKVKVIQELQARGERVCFVGDGINDAPALETADLGIAVSAASDVAREAADIILLNSEIEAVPEAIRMARATLRTIKQNLFWAFFYNATGVPLAMLGFFTPILSAIAMGASDLIVIGNALRLRYRGK